MRVARARLIHSRLQIFGERSRYALVSRDIKSLPVVDRQESECRLAQTQRPTEDRLEYRRYVRRRACDHLEDVRGRGLPFKGFPRLVEQSRVLDGDHGLIGEALLQRQLLVGERREAVAIDDERADRLALAPERRAADRANPHGAGGHRRPVRHRRIDIVQIGDVDLPVLLVDGRGQTRSVRDQR